MLYINFCKHRRELISKFVTTIRSYLQRATIRTKYVSGEPRAERSCSAILKAAKDCKFAEIVHTNDNVDSVAIGCLQARREI